MVNPEYSKPEKWKGKSLIFGTSEVRAKSAKTLVSQAKSPKVKRLSGSKRILIKGINRKLINIKIRAAAAKVLNPPS